MLPSRIACSSQRCSPINWWRQHHLILPFGSSALPCGHVTGICKLATSCKEEVTGVEVPRCMLTVLTAVPIPADCRKGTGTDRGEAYASNKLGKPAAVQTLALDWL